MSTTPAIRISSLNRLPPDPTKEFVLYWMIAFRRLQSNFALDRAIEIAAQLNRPLLIFEPLRIGYPWASDRFHQFIIDGMTEHQRVLQESPITYYPYIEPHADHGKGLLAELASHACAVVTDHFPCFMIPSMVKSAAAQVKVQFEQIDSNGLLPIRSAEKTFGTAVECRRFLQRNLRGHLEAFPSATPIQNLQLPRYSGTLSTIMAQWPKAELDSKRGSLLAPLSIDHSVTVVHTGGEAAAQQTLARFVSEKLSRYGEDRNHPDLDGGSGLSPYLHFGHLSTHQIFSTLATKFNWSPHSMKPGASGKRQGWWGFDETTEGFLDELVTWRELGFNFTFREESYDTFESLPAWARKTLNEHREDPRLYRYTLEQFEHSNTHDPLWNAAQRQIVHEGKMHNYLRMLWGKKILEWTDSPEAALSVMIHLNNKYGLDGRDPNSYTGIFWVLGRYDRPWPPERKIFGSIRYMSSDNTARKLHLKKYLERWSQRPLL